MSSAPFFIVGSGRSGTTLLRAMLASHSRIAIPPETWYLLRIFGKIDAKRPLTPSEVDTVVQIMTGHYRWPDMKWDAGEFRRRASELKTPRLRDIIELVYQRHVAAEGKQRWGDKTPGYIAIVRELVDMFPDAKFIHFIRDGRDAARSFQSQGWYGRRLHENTKEWLEAMDFNSRWRSSNLAHLILQVRYEDLVLDTEKTLRDICHFLDEQFEPQMLSWQTRVDELVPAREASIHVKLKQAPNPNDIFRWKREMNAREVYVSEAFMGRYLEELGYERRYRGFIWTAAFAMTRWYFRALWPAAAYPVRVLRGLRDKALGRTQRAPATGRQ